MKTILKITTFLALLLSSNSVSFSQVGIGNYTPDTTSTLDLTNSDNLGFLLPKATTFNSMSTSNNGMLYYYEDNIFVKTSYGYNGLSPWRFRTNRSAGNNVYYNLSGNVGIGTTSPKTKFHLSSNLINSLGFSNGSFMISSSSSSSSMFLKMDYQSIQAGSNGSPLTLHLNKLGGSVSIGKDDGDATTNVTINDNMVIELDLKVKGGIKANLVKQEHDGDYHELLPAGSIIMFYDDSIPPGWGLCDGTQYDRSIGTGKITAPDLRGKFIVGASETGISNHTAKATSHTYRSGNKSSNKDAITLGEGEIPSHYHGAGSLKAVKDGKHKHSLSGKKGSSDGDHGHNASFYDHSRSTSAPSQYTNNAGDHTHDISGSTSPKGGSGSHENRPNYYALVYIMKL